MQNPNNVLVLYEPFGRGWYTAVYLRFVRLINKKLSSQDSETPKPLPQVAVDIGDIPDKHTVLKLKKLEEEGKAAFEIMMKYHSSSHISR